MERVEVNLDNIKFWNENPREPLRAEWGDLDIISHYKKYEKLDDLIKSIKEQGLLEDIIGMRDKEDIKVYDGNRRIAALKWISLENPHKELMTIHVKLYDDVQEVLKVIDTLHGTGNGASRRRWSPFQRDRFNAKVQFPLSSPKAYKFITKNGVNKYTSYIRDKYIEYTTLERILSYKYLNELFLNVTENQQLDVLIELAKNTRKKIDSRNSKNEKSFVEVFGTELEKICEKYKVTQTRLWESFSLTEDNLDNKGEVGNNEVQIAKGYFTNNSKLNKRENTTNYNVVDNYSNRNSASRKSYRFFDYSNMNRPPLEVGELSKCLTRVSQLSITENNFENTIPTALLYRPVLEAHIRLLGNKLSQVFDLKKKRRINNLGLESLLDTAEKGVCNKKSIYKVYEFGKEFGAIKRGTGFDKNEIKRYSDLMGDIAHGKKFYCNFEELVELDKFVKKYIGVIYGILNEIG